MNITPTEDTLMRNMDPQQRALFTAQMCRVRKHDGTGFALAFLLGGLGAHRFYLGQIWQGVLYVLFCWTWVPAILALFEAFLMSRPVRVYNEQRALEVAAQVRAVSPSAIPTMREAV